jgi:hypothetical protein
MNWTIALAAFGAITGAAGLSWQFLNYRLTGGRVQILAIHSSRNGHQQVVTNVVNVGRLDVSIVGYSAWPDLPGYRLRKLRWRLGMARRAGLARARRTLICSSPSVHVHAPVEFGDGVRSIELPVVLKAGAMLALPGVEIEWSAEGRRKLRVAIHLGSGRIVQAYSLAPDSFQPIEVKRRRDAPDIKEHGSLNTITFLGGHAQHRDADEGFD